MNSICLSFWILPLICFTAETRLIASPALTVESTEFSGNDASLMNNDFSPGSTVDHPLSSSTIGYIYKNKATVGAVPPKYKILPLAVGGIALLAGLVTLFIVVGLFIYCNRSSNFVYESANTSDIENHI